MFLVGKVRTATGAGPVRRWMDDFVHTPSASRGSIPACLKKTDTKTAFSTLVTPPANVKKAAFQQKQELGVPLSPPALRHEELGFLQSAAGLEPASDRGIASWAGVCIS
jgi:hypothetical protein